MTTLGRLLDDSRIMARRCCPRSSPGTPPALSRGLDGHRLDLVVLTHLVDLALDEAVRDGRIKRGHLVLMEAMGGGLTWAAGLVRW